MDNRALWHIFDLGGEIVDSTIHVLFNSEFDFYLTDSELSFEEDTILAFDYDAAGLSLVFGESYDISLYFETTCDDIVDNEGLIIYAIDEDGRILPSGITLEQNRPNPFNSYTEIIFELPTGGHAVLTIHDLYGRLVKTLHSGNSNAGGNTVVWDGTDETGSTQASGYYLYRLVTQDTQLSKGMFLLK